MVIQKEHPYESVASNCEQIGLGSGGIFQVKIKFTEKFIYQI